MLWLAYQLQVHLAVFHAHTHYLHTDLIAQPEAHSGTLADQAMFGSVVMEVVTTEGRHMHQALNVNSGKLHKEPERHNGCNHAVVLLAYVILEVFAFEPGHDVPRCVVGAALRHRAVLTQLMHSGKIIRVIRQFRVTLGRHRYVFATVLAVNHGLDTAMHDQIRITANRRGEVGITGKPQAEMATLIRAVDGLTERAQHHRLNDIRVGTVCNTGQQRLIISGGWLVSTPQLQPQLAQEKPHRIETLLGWAIVHPVQ